MRDLLFLRNKVQLIRAPWKFWNENKYTWLWFLTYNRSQPIRKDSQPINSILYCERSSLVCVCGGICVFMRLPWSVSLKINRTALVCGPQTVLHLYWKSQFHTIHPACAQHWPLILNHFKRLSGWHLEWNPNPLRTLVSNDWKCLCVTHQYFSSCFVSMSSCIFPCKHFLLIAQ